MVSGNNGILQRATDAKTQTEIGQEKETIALAYNSALAKKVGNGDSTAVTAGDLNIELTNQGANANGSNPIIVSFENGHKYSIDSSANIDEYILPTVSAKLASELFEYDGTTEGKIHIGDYVNYPVIYTNVATCVDTYSKKESYFPKDTYTGWRVLSIEGSGENQYIKLVSAGTPLNYYHYNNSATSVDNLTTKLFETPINSTITQYNFYQCGFTEQPSDATTISKNIFNNNYTAKYTEGKNVGNPKVQVMTKEDVYYGDNLEAIPCKESEESEYAITYLASDFDNSDLWSVDNYGEVSNHIDYSWRLDWCSSYSFSKV